jgi:hypothetical protein
VRRSVAVLVLLCASAARAFAADLDANEKKWVATCIDNLASKSALIRGSAEKAISGLGQDALPAVVAASVKLKTDDEWQGLSRAIAGMGAGARKALDGLRMSWPKGTEKRFADMLDFLDKAEADAKKNGPVPLPTSPADVKARVKEILDGYRDQRVMKTDDQAILDLISLGHPAVGALLEALDARDSNDHLDSHSERYAIQWALARLAEASDAPTLTALLRKGRTKVALALNNIDAPGVLDAFVEAIDAGYVDSDLVEGLDRRGKEPRIQKALCAWLHKNLAMDRQWVIGGVAEFLERNRAPDAVAALLPYLKTLTDLQPRQFVALALANLGEKAGIPVLIEILTMSDSHGLTGFNYPRHCAGNELNRISGTTIYTGKEISGGGPGMGPERYDADWGATAKAFRDWWTKNKDRLHFDPTTRVWSVQ